MDLEDYRSKIVNCDYRILKVLEQRYNWVLKVSNYKEKNRKPILDKKREEGIRADFLKNMSHTYFKRYHEEEFIKIINAIMEVSRDIQYRKIYKKILCLLVLWDVVRLHLVGYLQER